MTTTPIRLSRTVSLSPCMNNGAWWRSACRLLEIKEARLYREPTTTTRKCFAGWPARFFFFEWWRVCVGCMVWRTRSTCVWWCGLAWCWRSTQTAENGGLVVVVSFVWLAAVCAQARQRRIWRMEEIHTRRHGGEVRVKYVGVFVCCAGWRIMAFDAGLLREPCSCSCCCSLCLAFLGVLGRKRIRWYGLGVYQQLSRGVSGAAAARFFVCLERVAAAERVRVVCSAHARRTAVLACGVCFVQYNIYYISLI